MNYESFFLYGFLISYGILLFWFLMYWLAKDHVYKLHNGVFEIPREDFNKIHYFGMAIFKVMIFVLYLVPYIAIKVS